MVVVAVAGDPDVALLVDVNAVLGLGPVVARARPAPAPEQLAVGGELQHRRRRDAAACLGRGLLCALLVVDQRGGPMDDPDVVLAVDGDAGDLAEDPFVGQRLGPVRIDGELGRLGVGLRGDRSAGGDECGSQGRKQQAVHGRSPGRPIGPRGDAVSALMVASLRQSSAWVELSSTLPRGAQGCRKCMRDRYRRRSGANSRAIDIAMLDRSRGWPHVSGVGTTLQSESPWNAV